jgi:hypothetical protein
VKLFGVGGHPEGFVILSSVRPDKHGAPEQRASRLVVNVPEAGEVVSIDLNTGHATHRKLAGVGSNFPMCAFQRPGSDPLRPTTCVIVGCRTPPKLLMLDADTGDVRAEAPCAPDVDDLVLSGRDDRLYAICGGDGGVIDCYSVAANSITPAGRVPTSPGARTGAAITLPDHRPAIAVACPARGETPAEVRVFVPKSHPPRNK